MISRYSTRAKISGFVAACLVVQGTLVCFAEPPDEAPEADKTSPPAQAFKSSYGSHLAPILKKIDATEEQKLKITAIVKAYKPRIQPLRLEYKQKSQEFLDCLVEGRCDSDIMVNQGELNDLYSEIIGQYSRMRLDIRRLLKPEQVKKFEEYRRQQGWSSK